MTMPIKARLVSLNRIDDHLRNKVIEYLEKEEVIFTEVKESEQNIPVILFFDVASSEFFDCLKQECNALCGRQACVITVARSPTTLSNGVKWQILKYGANDVLICNKEAPEAVAAQIVSRIKRWHELQDVLQQAVVRKNMIGSSACWQSILKRTVEIGRFTDLSVLLLGESGTGKELFARLIHTLDARENKGELVILDCSTIMAELSGSEFFGHERGAFTGAVEGRDGAFALADGGTLFLDEVGELPLPLQAQLLRVIQERTYKRVGGNQWKKTDFRLICATNRDLVKDVQKGHFRGDLYYRIAMCTFHLPPLRECPEDVMPLTRYFLAELVDGGEALELDDAVKDYLIKRPYTGNVRELKQLVTRIKCRHVGEGPITVGDIPEEDRPEEKTPELDWQDYQFEEAIQRAVAFGASLKDIGQAASEAAIRIALGAEEGNLKRAAEKLGVTARALQLRRANQN